MGGHGSRPPSASPYEDPNWTEECDEHTFRSYYKVRAIFWPVSIELTQDIQDWHKTVRDIASRSLQPRGHPNTTGDVLENLVFHGQIVVMGDAAYPHASAFGLKASLGIDDAYTLMRSIIHHQDNLAQAPAQQRKREVARCLNLYERARKPHVSKIGKGGDVEEMYMDAAWDDAKLRNWAKELTEPYWIHEHSADAAFEDAISPRDSEDQA